MSKLKVMGREIFTLLFIFTNFKFNASNSDFLLNNCGFEIETYLPKPTMHLNLGRPAGTLLMLSMVASALHKQVRVMSCAALRVSSNLYKLAVRV